MTKVNVIKDKLQFLRLVKEEKTEIIKREEYLIPDTQQDVNNILSVEARTIISNKEILNDKVIVEGYVEYNIIYAPRDDSIVLNSVHYTEKFTENILIDEVEHKINCDVECKMEHIEARVMNERKIEVQGNISLSLKIYRKLVVDYVKEIETSEENMQMLKEEEQINKMIANNEYDMENNAVIRASMDKPIIGKILSITTRLYKKEIRTLDGKVNLSCYCKVKIMYLGVDLKEVAYIEEDIYISKDEEIVIESAERTISQVDYKVHNIDAKLQDDDLGETRIINLNLLIKSKVKIFVNEEVELIKDAYSTKNLLTINKKEYDIGVENKLNDKEVIVKKNIENMNDEYKLSRIFNTIGRIISINREQNSDRINVNGDIEIEAIVTTDSDETPYTSVSGILPFEFSMDIPDEDNDCMSIVNLDIEDIEANVEGNSIAVKVILGAKGSINYCEKKTFIEDVIEEEEEVPEVNASMVIYVVEEGDTLWNLAKRYNTTINDIVQMNNIEEADNIAVGDKLIIPGRAIF